MHAIYFPQGGTAHNDAAHAIVVLEDGSTILAGSSKGDWNAPNLGDQDFAACRLHGNGSLLWKWQVIEIFRRNV